MEDVGWLAWRPPAGGWVGSRFWTWRSGRDAPGGLYLATITVLLRRGSCSTWPDVCQHGGRVVGRGRWARVGCRQPVVDGSRGSC